MIIEILDNLGSRLDNKSLLDALGSLAVSRIQNRIDKGSFTPNAPLTQAVKRGKKPLKDGKGPGLLPSIAYKVGSDEVVLGTSHPAANILHNGGTIVPKKTRFLAIPASAWTRACLRQYGSSPRTCIEAMKADKWNIWSYVNGGKGCILAKKGKGKAKVLFLLRRSITIPARKFFILDELDKKMLVATVKDQCGL